VGGMQHIGACYKSSRAKPHGTYATKI